MQTTEAYERNLMVLRYGLLKRDAPFDPAWASRPQG
jgi:hypothetical protein